jgi:MFS family permease
MRRRTAAWVAWSVCAVSLLIMALGLLVVFFGWSAPLPTGWYPWTYLANDVLPAFGAPILGGLIASRRPENPYGWLWLGLGIGFALATFAPVYAAYALVVEPGSLPAPRTLASLGESEGYVMIIILAPFLFLVFPNGRLPSRRWRLLARSTVAVGTVLAILALFLAEPAGQFMNPIGIETRQFKNPIGIEGSIGEMIGILFFGGELVLVGASILSALSLVFRYRGAGFEERQRIKWFAYAAAFVSVYILLTFFLSELLVSLLGSAALFGLYAAIAIAILKHHLFDIDLVINRTLVYGALTVVIAGIFVIIDEVVQEVFLIVTRQEESWLSVIVSALAISALFEPLKDRIQRFVDRRIFRQEDGTKKSGASISE